MACINMAIAARMRLASTQDQRARRTRNLPMAADAPVTGAVKRDRPPADAAEHLQGATFELDERCRRDSLRVGLVAEKQAVKKHAQW